MSTDWKEIYRRFDPDQPAARSGWRVARSYSPFQKILERLDFDEGPCRVLLTGTVGCGKTTELLRVAEARWSQEFVVYFDIDRHFATVLSDSAALGSVRAWEVVFLVGVQLVREAEDKLGYLFSDDIKRELGEAWARVARASGTEGAPETVDISALSKMMITLSAGAAGALWGPAAAAGVAALKDLGASPWNTPIGRSSKELSDQDEEAQNLLSVVNRMLGEIHHRHRPVLLVLDGLDKVHEIPRARSLFVDSELLAQLACSMVVCGPYSLRHHPSLATVRGFYPVILVNEPVFLPDQPRMEAPGLKVLEAMFHARTADLASSPIVPGPKLLKLAWASGGRGRDFVRLVRELARKCFQAKVDVATEALVEDVIDDTRRLWEVGLHRGHREVLRAVMAEPAVLPAEPLVWELLELDKLLPYPNESEWYYPHSLLLLNFLKAA